MMPSKAAVLIAILNYKRDFSILREEQWYRIPVESVERMLKDRWPPQWLGFYQTKEFGTEAYSINHYAKVEDIKVIKRLQLFPKEPRNEESEKKILQNFCRRDSDAFETDLKQTLSTNCLHTDDLGQAYEGRRDQ